jgi:F-type H+-transporting ATPase subunit c
MDLSQIALGYIGVGIGAGLAILGAALGIGKLAGAAMEGSARQPEAAGTIRTSMIIAAALIEGLGFFALVVCFIMVLALNGVLSRIAGAAAGAGH